MIGRRGQVDPGALGVPFDEAGDDLSGRTAVAGELVPAAGVAPCVAPELDEEQVPVILAGAELLLVTGSYQMLARIMTTLEIDIDEAVGGAVLDRARRLLDPIDEGGKGDL